MIITSTTTVEEIKEKTKNTLENMCNVKNASEKSTTGDTVRKIMRLTTSRVSFSDYDFIRLFFAYVKLNGIALLDTDSLRYDLYEFYNVEEYRELFQDIAVKKPIEGNYLDIEEALQSASLYGLLSDYNTNPWNSKRLILLNEEESYSIIDGYDNNYTEKMESLTGKFIENKFAKSTEPYHFKGKIKTLKKNIIKI